MLRLNKYIIDKYTNKYSNWMQIRLKYSKSIKRNHALDECRGKAFIYLTTEQFIQKLES